MWSFWSPYLFNQESMYSAVFCLQMPESRTIEMQHAMIVNEYMVYVYKSRAIEMRQDMSVNRFMVQYAKAE